MNKVYIFGHKKPDTDSVTASIALSYLKNKLGILSEPRILDHINKETEFVLKYFNIEVPEYLEDVKIQVKDLNYYKNCFISEFTSISNTFDYLMKNSITGVPVVDKNNKLKGVLTSKNIGNEIINGNYYRLKTSYKNIVDVLLGKEILNFNDEIEGEILTNIYSYNRVELKENSILIIDNNDLKIIDYIKSGVKLLVLANNYNPNQNIVELARLNKINIIRTNYDILTTYKKIGLSNYVKNLIMDMRTVYFNENDYYGEFKNTCIKLGHNNYPVVDDNNNCLGLVRITDIDEINKKQVILVDHNEASQSVDGLEEAEILEIVDHHKIGALTTNMPINFRNMTVGSTNTIIYSMYEENNISIPKDIAGIMLSGIISDTLKFTSPTTTSYDKIAAKYLADICKINIEEYSNKMFKAGTNLKGKTIEQIIDSDIKIYDEKNKKIAISQLITLNSDEILSKKDEYVNKINEIKNNRGYDVLLLCVTDIIKDGSYILFDSESIDLVKNAFNNNEIYEGYFFNDCLSRKKQIIPYIIKVII